MCGERDWRVWGVSVEKCGGDVGKCVGGDEICGKMWGRCGKVCWGVGKVRGDVGKCVVVQEEVWGSVGEDVRKCVG